MQTSGIYDKYQTLSKDLEMVWLHGCWGVVCRKLRYKFPGVPFMKTDLL